MARMKKDAACTNIFLLSCFVCGPRCAEGARPWSIGLDAFRPWTECEASTCAPVACTFSGDYDGAPLARTGTCPTGSCPNSNCDKLVLYNLNITSVPAPSFESMSNVTTLILRGNAIKSLSGVVFPPSLVALDLSENKLESLRGVVWPASLKALDLGRNNIVSLDGVVFPSSLTRLRLSYNPIESLPPAVFSNLASLKELAIRSIGDNISCVPLASQQLKQLTTYLGPSTQCIAECDAGYEVPEGGVCKACAAGYFKNVPGSHSCTVCPVQHESSPDKTSCILQFPVCGPGYELSGYTAAVECRESCKACHADFRVLDANKDASISKEEFSTHSTRFASFDSFDTDGGGLVTLNEFLAGAPDKQQNNCTVCSDCVVRKPSIRVGTWVTWETWGIVVAESESKTDKSYKVLWAQNGGFSATSDWTNQIKIAPQSSYFWKNCVEWGKISSAKHDDWCREEFGPTFIQSHAGSVGVPAAQLDCPVGFGKGLCYSRQVDPLCAYCTSDKFKDVAGLHPCSECPADHESNIDRTACIPCPLFLHRAPGKEHCTDSVGLTWRDFVIVVVTTVLLGTFTCLFACREMKKLLQRLLQRRRKVAEAYKALCLGPLGLGDALCEASQSGDIDLVCELLKAGADVNHEREGRSAIALAANEKVSEKLVLHIVQKPWRKDSIVQKLWRDAGSVVVLDHVGVGKGMEEDYTFEFGGCKRFFGWSRTFSTFQADVKLSGGRFYYELEIKHLQGGARFGWAQILDEAAAETKGWKSSAECSYAGVGDNPFSWAFKCKWHNGIFPIFGQILKKGDVLGLACDMINKSISFSLNGSFDAPFGVAFKPIAAEWIAPAFTASEGSQVVANFGAPRQFKHAPPDDGYVSVHDAAKSRQSRGDNARLNQPDCVVTVLNESDDSVHTLTKDNADGVRTETRNAMGAALCATSKCGDLGMLLMLLNAGADVNYKDADGKTAVDLETETNYRTLDTSRFLLESGDLVRSTADPKRTGTVLMLQSDGDSLVRWGDTGLNALIKSNKVEKIMTLNKLRSSIRKTLLDAGCLPSDALNKPAAVLCAASKSGDLLLVSVLFKAGTDVNHTDTHGKTQNAIALAANSDTLRIFSPLWAPTKEGKLEVKTSAGEIKELEFTWAGFGRRPSSITDVAAVLCDPELAEQELNNAEQLSGNVAVVRRGAMKCISSHSTIFVEKAQRAEKAGALALVVINSDNTRFEAAADIRAPEADAFQAHQVTIPVLMVTADAADTLLAESGAQVSLKGDKVNVAGATCDTNTIGAAGLLAASRSGDLGLLCTFLNMGADVNYRDAADGKTALCIASKCGQPEALRILIERGADVNCQDADGKTAVDLAPELAIYTGSGYIPLQGTGIYTSKNHPHSTCDTCGASPIKGPRWKCKTRSDFDLCDKCYMQHQGDGTYTYEKKIGDYTEEELAKLNRACRERALIEHGYPDINIIEKDGGYTYCKKDISGLRITTGDLVRATENPRRTGTVTTHDLRPPTYTVRWDDTGAESGWMPGYEIEKIIVLQSWKELKSSIRKTLLEAGCLPSAALNNIAAALCEALDMESEDLDLSSALFKALKTYTLGLKWEEAGSDKPSAGTEIKNVLLAAALQENVEFKKEEWETFHVANLSSDSYIRAGNRYFKPAGADVNYTDANGKTPLIMASECGHLDMVKKLLEIGADVNYTDANGKTSLIIASECGHVNVVKTLLEEGADVNCKDTNGKTAVDLAASRSKGGPRGDIQLTLREQGGLTSDELFRKNNIVGDDYNTIVEAAKESLEEAPQSKRMVGDLQDLRAGEFKDTANGLKQFLKVREDWAPAKECAELEEEVRRLRDCPQCAKVQADVLKEMASEGTALLLKTSDITARLSGDLVALQSARRTGNDKEEETRLEEQVEETRKEIDDIGGWYYGCKNAPAVAWPESKVNHDWGKYGQPMCDRCKKYALDYSTISADLNYCLHEVSSEKVCFNGVRDKGRAGKTIDYFVELPEAKDTGMNKPEAASLRFYSSHSFGAVTNPLRDPTRETEHPLAAITYCIDQAIRKQLKWGSKDKNAASQERVLWRGFSDLKISDEFKEFGGTEFAPMSTTTDVRVAVGYAIRKTTTGGALLMRIVTKNNLERGMDLKWISMFPGESERLLAPLTFMNKPKRFQEIEVNGANDQKVKLTVVEIEVTTPPM